MFFKFMAIGQDKGHFFSESSCNDNFISKGNSMLPFLTFKLIIN